MDGMFTSLLTPIMNKIYPCTIEEVRNNIQKEKRIIDTLEPVLNQHKLIVGKEVIREDIESLKNYPDEVRKEYSLIYQMTHLTKDKGCLAHDDRLDCLAIAVKACLEMLMVDVDKIIAEQEEAEWERELAEYYGFDISTSNWFEL